MDTSALEDAYRELVELAASGGFAQPADEQAWSPEWLLAAVVATNRLLLSTSAALIAGAGSRYDTAAATTPAALDALVRSTGDWDTLVTAARQTGRELVFVVRELTEGQAHTPVPTRITSGDAVRVDATMPWTGVLNTYAEVDLPTTTQRLSALH
jgi:hypothetical protein